MAVPHCTGSWLTVVLQRHLCALMVCRKKNICCSVELRALLRKSFLLSWSCNRKGACNGRAALWSESDVPLCVVPLEHQLVLLPNSSNSAMIKLIICKDWGELELLLSPFWMYLSLHSSSCFERMFTHHHPLPTNHAQHLPFRCNLALNLVAEAAAWESRCSPFLGQQG